MILEEKSKNLIRREKRKEKLLKILEGKQKGSNNYFKVLDQIEKTNRRIANIKRKCYYNVDFYAKK